MLFSELQGNIPIWNCIHFNLSKVLISGIVTAVILSDTECEVGYIKVGNDCADMCEGINCGIGGNCTSGNCTCQTGYSKVENVCVDMCEGINCGIGGNCLKGNCTCQKGYANVDNSCEEICALTSCQELILIWQK